MQPIASLTYLAVGCCNCNTPMCTLFMLCAFKIALHAIVAFCDLCTNQTRLQHRVVVSVVVLAIAIISSPRLVPSATLATRLRPNVFAQFEGNSGISVWHASQRHLHNCQQLATGNRNHSNCASCNCKCQTRQF